MKLHLRTKKLKKTIPEILKIESQEPNLMTATHYVEKSELVQHKNTKYIKCVKLVQIAIWLFNIVYAFVGLLPNIIKAYQELPDKGFIEVFSYICCFILVLMSLLIFLLHTWEYICYNTKNIEVGFIIFNDNPYSVFNYDGTIVEEDYFKTRLTEAVTRLFELDKYYKNIYCRLETTIEDNEDDKDFYMAVVLRKIDFCKLCTLCGGDIQSYVQEQILKPNATEIYKVNGEFVCKYERANEIVNDKLKEMDDTKDLDDFLYD